MPAMSVVQKFVDSFEDYPPRQASFDVNTDSIMDAIMAPNTR